MTIWEMLPTDVAFVHDLGIGVFCGAVAGIIAKTVVAPAERIKMSFQVTSEPFTYHAAYKRGVDIIKTGGIFALWKGHSTTVLRVAPYAGFSYAIHDLAEGGFKKLAGEPLPVIFKFLAGSIGGIGGTLLTYPLDVLRVRLALIPNLRLRTGLTQGGLYHGLVPTLLGIIPYAGTVWCVKQSIQELYIETFHIQIHSFYAFLINALAGVSGQLITYPLDIVRRRMQMNITNDCKSSLNIRQVMSSIIAKEGYKGLTKGFSINIVKGPLTLGISLTSYDLLKRMVIDIEESFVQGSSTRIQR